MEEKKNTGLIWLIVVLIILFAGLVSLVAYKTLEKNNENDFQNTTTNKESNLNNNSNITVLRRDNYIYELNGKEHTVSFLYEKEEQTKEDEINSWVVDEEEAKEEESFVFSIVYLKILIDEKEINHKITYYYNFYETDENMPLLTRDNINKISGDNKEYLVFEIKHELEGAPFQDGGINPLIVDNEGNIIYELKFTDAQTINVFENVRSNIYNNSEKSYVISDNKIYYLDAENIVGERIESEEYETVQEYELTISNGKVKIKALDTYKGMCAGAC